MKQVLLFAGIVMLFGSLKKAEVIKRCPPQKELVVTFYHKGVLKCRIKDGDGFSLTHPIAQGYENAGKEFKADSIWIDLKEVVPPKVISR